MTKKKVLSEGGMWFYVLGYVSPLNGAWLHVETDEVKEFSDATVKSSEAADAVQDASKEEVDRYVRVMRRRKDSAEKS